MSILSLGCSNKPIEKEMKMPTLFDTKEQAEKEAYKFGCEGAHKWEINGCRAVCINITIRKEQISSFFILTINVNFPYSIL